MWEYKNTFSIGGLQEVGFADGKDYLIVLSSQGEAIFDCIDGEKIARVHNDFDWWNRYDANIKKITGFNILESEKINISGLTNGDSLSKSTSDFWTLDLEVDFNISRVEKIFLSWRGLKKNFIGEDGPCELRAYGFSPTEKSLIFASSCELIIFSR